MAGGWDARTERAVGNETKTNPNGRAHGGPTIRSDLHPRTKRSPLGYEGSTTGRADDWIPPSVGESS